MSGLLRCPFVRAVSEKRTDDAIRLATAPPDPAEPVVVEWLIAEARRQLAGDAWYAAREALFEQITGQECTHPAETMEGYCALCGTYTWEGP